MEIHPRLEIRPGTALCGIVLHPAGHTRSPAMHNAAYEALGIDAVYLAFDVPAERLDGAIAGIRALGLRQVSVSLPHKERVIALLDEVTPRAQRIGAVNTIVRRGDALVGSNTDADGAIRALEREVKLEGTRAVVLGAGGAARALVVALQDRGARVRILNRSLEKARALCDAFGAEDAGGLDALADAPYDVLVNTTSVGLSGDASPVAAETLSPDAVVMDAVYEPERTRLLRDAEARGARVVPGKWMLVHQAALQLEAWTGREAPVEVMSRAFDRAAQAG